MGEQTLKNIAQPVRVYSVRLDSAQSIPAVMPPAAPANDSIAVLPFTNMGGDPEQDYFAEGIAEDILTELSRFRNLFVIARNSSFSFKGKGLGIQDIARALNVEYIVSGSVRRAGNRVRVAAQLAHAATGQEIWADRYDRELEDIFKVQDEVVRTIVVTLESRLGMAIANNAGSRNTPSLAAYECVQLARKYINVHDAPRALPYVERALELDAGYALAHIVLSAAYYVEYLENSQAVSLERMEAAARMAVALDGADSRGQAALGMALTFKRQYELAGSHLERAIGLNPADTSALAYQAEWLVRNGDAAKALTVMDQLLQRDPIPPPWHWEIRAMALIMLGHYQEAILAISRTVKQFWYLHALLAICHARLDQPEEAKAEIGKLLLLRPGMTVRQYQLFDVFRRQEDRDFIAEGLRLAGLPE